MALPKAWTQVTDSKILESGQAWVYEVARTANPDGSRFALKKLKNPRRADRFRREVEAMRSLAAAGISVPEVVETGILEKGRPYVVTPWYAGGSLEDKVIDKAFVADPIAGLRVLIDIAIVLDQIHKAGFAHRDLKPSNILLDGHSIIVADFGLALPVDDDATRLTATTEGVGSRFYIAPENESGINLDLDQRPADFYAFAKVIYALLAGRQPRAGMGQLQEGHRLEQLTATPNLEILSALQKDLLNPDPRARLQQWAVVIRELEAAEASFHSPKSREPETEDVVQLAMLAARRYAASRQALSSDEANRQKEDRRQLVESINQSMRSGFHAWTQQVSRLNDQLGTTVLVACSSGGFSLKQFLEYEAIQDFLERRGVPFKEESESNPQFSGGSPALFHVQLDLPPLSETLALAGFPFVVGMSVWFLRLPIFASYGPDPRKLIPTNLLEEFGDASGPFRIGLTSTVRQAEEFGQSCGRLGIRLVTRFLSDPTGRLVALVSI
ncbi:protein kinase [Micromonospora sp. KC721]|uniref:protein kinase domain-containing protein n=1 Tax=Micromonospora sp. KC721 TaxID=2530380 RepID=UPI0014047187|nr:protein kinase [Micromonospora sp. KC721]